MKFPLREILKIGLNITSNLKQLELEAELENFNKYLNYVVAVLEDSALVEPTFQNY